jgi:Fe-S cluster assembly protein SufD
VTVTTAFDLGASQALGGPSWLAVRRAAAAERFAAGELPTTNEEIWKFSRIAELDLDKFRPAGLPGTEAAEGITSDQEFISGVRATVAAITDFAGVVIVRNGRVLAVDVDEKLTAEGVVIGDLANQNRGGQDDGWIQEHLGRCSAASSDAFVELHDAFLAGGAAIFVPPHVVIDRPILVVHRGAGDGLASFPHTLVVAGENSEVTVADHFSSDDGVHLSIPVVELELADAARVRYLSLQVLGAQTWQIALQRGHLGRDSTLRTSAIALGGDYARLRGEAALMGQGASSDQLAVYYADGEQTLDFRTLQDHSAPFTTSDLLFKGAVEDHARSVYSGMVHLREGAQKATATQSNRNLVLSENASAESIPNLVIEANDVRCSHASAVGPIDDDQLYYLETRGVPPDVAERLVVFGFFEDVIERLTVASLAAPLRQAVHAKWDRRGA